ncbi:MAG: malate synthase A [Acidobacteriota bacterium]
MPVESIREVSSFGWAAGSRTAAAEEILPQPVQELLVRLHRALEGERRELLAARRRRQQRWDGGALPGFVDDLPAARGEWQIAPLPDDLLQRRVEITGPIHDPKMVINMLSRQADGARADAAMLDFEDSMKPCWANVVQGVQNLDRAVAGTLSHERPATAERPAKVYRLEPADRPLIMVRCRGLHLDEDHVAVDGEAVCAGLFDLALAVFWTARELLEQGRTPKYYVPKVEHHREAAWWHRLFGLLEESLGLAAGCLRVTFLIETLPAAFQVEEILWQLRDRAAGLNVGRWDKIFSDIKVLKEHPDRVLADRAAVTMESPWMKAYADYLVHVCHRHGAFAMGGMAAFTPGRTAEERERQTAKVMADKGAEAAQGHDGCWVSHPYFIAPALTAFPRRHQLDVMPELSAPPDLLPRGGGPRTVTGLRTNLRVGIAYLEGWLRDVGCVAWDGLMEDLATLEISRAQVWQQLRHRVVLDDGSEVTADLVSRLFDDELRRIEGELGAPAPSFGQARDVARRLFLEERFRPFLTAGPDLA